MRSHGGDDAYKHTTHKTNITVILMVLCIVDPPHITFRDIPGKFLEVFRSELPARLRGKGRMCYPYVPPTMHIDHRFYFKTQEDEQCVQKQLEAMNRELVEVRTQYVCIICILTQLLCISLSV